MELITVIIPVYNVEKYLSRCVLSVINQTYKNLEIILVDDASPDNCPQICDDFAKKDSRIKVIHKQNEGLGLSRNAGLNVAGGEYVTFIDSDDFITENHIENLYNCIKKHSADAVIGAHTIVSANGAKTEKSLNLNEGAYEEREIINQIVLPLIGTAPEYYNDIQINASCCMNLYNLNLIRKYNLMFISERQAVGEDLFFNLNFFTKSKRVAAINETGYCYFENINSISRKYTPERLERTVGFYNLLCETAKNIGIFDAAKSRIHRSFLMKIRVLMLLIVNSDLTKKAKKREIKNILNHNLVVRILSEYPLNKFIFSMRVFLKLMKRKNTLLVYWLLSFRKTAKSVGVLSQFLKLFGIGK